MKTIHKIFLLISLVLILHGVVLLLLAGGAADLKYFTTISNIFLALTFGLRVIFYDKNNTLVHYLIIASLVSIFITGMVYNFVLVPVAGYNHVFTTYKNFATHLLAPILALVNYFVFEPKGRLNFRYILASLVFPVAYWMVFVSIGGSINWYPYFFMNPEYLGWGQTLLWFAALLVTFAVFSFLLVLFDFLRK